MNSEQTQVMKDALAQAYDQGREDGYSRARREFQHFIAAMCKREPDDTIKIMDRELTDQGSAIEIETGRLPFPKRGIFYKLKE